MIITVCYGTQKTWETREEAMSFFLEAMMSCDGSEKDRYCNIYMKLQLGLNYCTDKDFA